MSLDQQGYLWLSEPWIAAFAVLVAIGLVLWSHLRLMGEDLNRPATVPARARSTRPTTRSSSVPGRVSLNRSAAAGREHGDAQRRRMA